MRHQVTRTKPTFPKKINHTLGAFAHWDNPGLLNILSAFHQQKDVRVTLQIAPHIVELTLTEKNYIQQKNLKKVLAAILNH
jgi:hypothetical protein